MKINLNAVKQDTDATTIAGLVALLNLQTDKIAIEVNLKIVTRGDYATTKISDGDNIEIIEFVGGG